MRIEFTESQQQRISEKYEAVIKAKRELAELAQQVHSEIMETELKGITHGTRCVVELNETGEQKEAYFFELYVHTEHAPSAFVRFNKAKNNKTMSLHRLYDVNKIIRVL